MVNGIRYMVWYVCVYMKPGHLTHPHICSRRVQSESDEDHNGIQTFSSNVAGDSLEQSTKVREAKERKRVGLMTS